MIKSTPRKFSYYQERYEPLLLVVYDLPRHEKFRPGITLAAAKKDLVKTLDLGVVAVKENGRGHFQDLYSKRADHDIELDKIAQNTYSKKYWLNGSPGFFIKHQAHQQLYYDLVWAYKERRPEDFLEALNKIFDYVVEVDFAAAREEKIEYLKKLLVHDVPRPKISEINWGDGTFPPLYKIIEPFLYKFNYHELLTEKFPAVKMLRRADGKIGIYDERDTISTVRLCPVPKVNELSPRLFNYPAAEPVYPVCGEGSTSSWYERQLPEVFKQLNLKYRRTVLVSEKVQARYGVAYGWEITTPLEELRQRQMICL